MFEDIVKQGKEQVSLALQQQHGMEKDKADKATAIMSDAAMEIGKKQVEQKDFTAIKEMVSGNVTTPDNPAIQNLVPQVASELVKNGFDAEQANTITPTAVVILFNMFNDKVTEAKQRGIDVPSLIEKFAGGGLGSMSALMGMAGSFMKGGQGGLMSGLLGKFMK